MAELRQRDASVLRRFEAFCALEGIARPQVALRDAALVEAFLALGCSDLAPHSRGTYRSALRRIARVETSDELASPFPASSAAPPYRGGDLASLWSIVAHQPSPSRVVNATVLFSAMVGAGLRPREVAALRHGDLEQHNGDGRVLVRGAHPRVVPLLSPYGDALLRAAASRRDFLFRPGAPQRSTKNLVGEICAALVRDPGEVALSSARARSTFICGHLQAGTPLFELCALAGLANVESLLRYARHVASAPHSKAALRRAS